MLKYKADIRTIGYMVTITGMFILQWIYGFNWIAYIVYLHFAVSVGVMTHNHNHVNIWTNKALNILTDWWLTIFYGLPIFVWIPTHNRNHHRHINKIEDTTRTYRHTENNDLVSVLMYPTVSGVNQIKEGIIPYMKELRTKNPDQYRQNWTQLGVLVIWLVAVFVLDWQKALWLVIIPHQVSQLAVIYFNYVQHVHADEESEYNNSRNFTGVNLFLFNNGYHTIHHLRASIHWSETPEAHKKIEHLILPELIESSLWAYTIKTYFLAPFIPAFRSKSMRLERIKNEQKAAAKPCIETGNVAEPVHTA